MTAKNMGKRALFLAALGLGIAAATAARSQGEPRVSKVSGNDPTTLAFGQSETACSISAFVEGDERRQIELVSANDDTEGLFLYTDTGRFVLSGASQMGWYFREVENGGGGIWRRGHLFPGAPGAAADVAVLWGDPGIASGSPGEPGVSGAPQLALMGTLMVPASKFPTVNCTTPQGTLPCIEGAVSGVCTPLGGACVARSLDGGETFDFLHCFRDTRPGACTAPPASFPERISTNGHFYDGMDIAISPGPTPRAAVAVNDVDNDEEALWTIDDAINGTEFVRQDGLGPMGPVTNGVLGTISLHIRLRYDSTSRLWRMGPEQDPNVAPPINNLKVNILGRSGSANVVALDLVMRRGEGNIQLAGVPPGVNDPTLGASIRFGPQYDFDIGMNESGVEEMRFVYATETHIQAGSCTMNLDCLAPPEWRSATNAALRQFHPAIKYGKDEVTGRHLWKVSYYELNADSTQVAIFAADVRRNGTTAVAFAPVRVTDFLPPCPDNRGPILTIPNQGDYWGDYDDMAFNPGSTSFLRPFTDSSAGCVLRQSLNSSHQHVSAVEIPECSYLLDSCEFHVPSHTIRVRGHAAVPLPSGSPSPNIRVQLAACFPSDPFTIIVNEGGVDRTEVVSGSNVAGFATAGGRENISLDVPIGDARFLNFPNMQQAFQDDCMTDEYEMRAWVDGQARSCGCVVASP